MHIEIPEEIGAALEEIARQADQDVASLAAEMLTEAIKMRRVPGIVFADGATGRRARIGGTGIEVFEVIDVYELVGRDRLELRRHFGWLNKFQLDMAVAYYEAFPDDIRPRLKSDEQVQAEMEELWAKYPRTSPNWPGRLRVTAEAASPQSARSGE
jgi:uncharacterized protein (DUF433 family)